MRAIVAKRIRTTARFVLVGAQVGVVVGLLIHQIEGGSPLPHVVRGIASGILIGLLVGIGEQWIFVGRVRWRRYLWVTCVRVAS